MSTVRALIYDHNLQAAREFQDGDTLYGVNSSSSNVSLISGFSLVNGELSVTYQAPVVVSLVNGEFLVSYNV